MIGVNREAQPKYLNLQQLLCNLSDNIIENNNKFIIQNQLRLCFHFINIIIENLIANMIGVNREAQPQYLNLQQLLCNLTDNIIENNNKFIIPNQLRLCFCCFSIIIKNLIANMIGVNREAQPKYLNLQQLLCNLTDNIIENNNKFIIPNQLRLCFCCISIIIKNLIANMIGVNREAQPQYLNSQQLLCNLSDNIIENNNKFIIPNQLRLYFHFINIIIENLI